MTKEYAMKKYQYLVGQKINKWTVLELNHDRRNIDAICKCECGTVKPVSVNNLINGKSKDCGCGRKAMLRETRTKDLTGKRFGKLTVVKLLDESSKRGRRQYECKCDCGSTVVTTQLSLTQGHIFSCGCLQSYYNSYIDQLLTKLNVTHKREYCVFIDGIRFRYDFYLPEYNAFIEYDGEQHYFASQFFGTDEENQLSLEKRQRYDRIKDQYCTDNNIELLRIPYYEKDNIDEIINNYLQRLNEKGLESRDMQQSELTI